MLLITLKTGSDLADFGFDGSMDSLKGFSNWTHDGKMGICKIVCRGSFEMRRDVKRRKLGSVEIAH